MLYSFLWLSALIASAVGAIIWSVRSRCGESTAVAAGHASPPWFVWNWIMPPLAWIGINVPNMCAPPQFRVMELATMFAVSRAIQLAAEWGVADQIHAKDKAGEGVPVEELAQLNRCDADKLARVLTHCVNHGVFCEKGGRGSRRFANNALSDALRSDSPVTIRDLVRVLGASAYHGLGELEYGLRAAPGAPTPFAHSNKGQGWWELMEAEPEKRAVFASAMTAVDSFSLQAIVEDFPWAQKLGAQQASGQGGAATATPASTGRLVDVAGSLGSVLKNVMRQVPSARGLLFDLPSVVPMARQLWAKENSDLIERVEFVAGSFFDDGAIPAALGSRDIYMLRNILHDWDDQKAALILRSVRRAIGDSGAKLVIIELIPAEPVDSMAAMKSFMDLNMLVTCDGKERSVQRHWRQLLDATRFRICSVTDTRSEYRILEAEPI